MYLSASDNTPSSTLAEPRLEAFTVILVWVVSELTFTTILSWILPRQGALAAGFDVIANIEKGIILETLNTVKLLMQKFTKLYIELAS